MKKIMKIWTVEVIDTDADLAWLTDPGRYEGVSPEDRAEYETQDKARLAAYNLGRWWFVGIKACAMIVMFCNSANWLTNEVSSGGLWGIESDSGDDYKKEIAQEELYSLCDALQELGFSDDDINEAMHTAYAHL